jgi:hypothetical protein
MRVRWAGERRREIKPMEKPLAPPPPVYNAFDPQDKWIARVNNIAPLEKPDPFFDCKNGSDRLARMLEIADESSLPGQAFNILTRP